MIAVEAASGGAEWTRHSLRFVRVNDRDGVQADRYVTDALGTSVT